MNVICTECAEVRDEELIEKGDSHFYMGTSSLGDKGHIDKFILWLTGHRKHGEIILEPEW